MPNEAPRLNPPAGWMAASAPWPAGVHAGCTLRSAGCSSAPWDSFNLGDHVGDRPQDVQSNRARLGQILDVQIPFLQQVHGIAVQELKAESRAGLCADACWTEVPRLAAAVLVADCLPLLLSSSDGGSVAAVHVGWRGLAGQGGTGILESLCLSWPSLACQRERSQVQVWLGPCIGPSAFEVGQDVVQALTVADQEAASCFQVQPKAGREPKYLANLPALVRRRLAKLGFSQIHGNDGSLPWCTYSQPERFFSHRRDAARLGSSGRMAALIWRDRP